MARDLKDVRNHLTLHQPKMGKQIFSKVALARELLREQASKILEDYLEVVAKAKDAGDYETAAKALQWLIEHMPADEAGDRLVDVSVDKKQQQQIVQAPAPVQIGIMVGGLGQQKALPKPKDKPIVEIVDAE